MAGVRDVGAWAPIVSLVEFEELDRAACLRRWRRQFGHEAPRYASVTFLRRVFAYEAQVKTYGGHSSAVRNVLKASLKHSSSAGTGNGASAMPSPAALRAGTHLVREWNGRSYRVEVRADGFVMDGKVYASLTSVARQITGTEWSGPRFFGLARS